MGKTRDQFNKVGYIKGTFCARMGIIKDKISTDLTEAKDIKRWQEYIAEIYRRNMQKKIFMTQITMMA